MAATTASLGSVPRGAPASTEPQDEKQEGYWAIAFKLAAIALAVFIGMIALHAQLLPTLIVTTVAVGLFALLPCSRDCLLKSGTVDGPPPRHSRVVSIASAVPRHRSRKPSLTDSSASLRISISAPSPGAFSALDTPIPPFSASPLRMLPPSQRRPSSSVLSNRSPSLSISTARKVHRPQKENSSSDESGQGTVIIGDSSGEEEKPAGTY